MAANLSQFPAFPGSLAPKAQTYGLNFASWMHHMELGLQFSNAKERTDLLTGEVAMVFGKLFKGWHMHVIFTSWMPLVADCNGISNRASDRTSNRVQPNCHLQWTLGATISPLWKPPYVAEQSEQPGFPGPYVPLLEILWALLARSINSPTGMGQNGFHLL